MVKHFLFVLKLNLKLAMVYLIKSASWNSEANKFEFILKIGYTKDQSAKKRFTSYGNHNPTIEILFKIPNATERHEGALHEYFRKFRIYNREWYEYKEEIIEFFKTHTTVESLDRDLPEYKFAREKQTSQRAVRLREFIDFVDKLEDPVLKSSLQSYLEEKTSYSRLRILYDLEESGLLTDKILDNLPDDKFKDYFKILGSKKVQSLGYNRTRLNHELTCKDVSFETSLVKAVYNEFHEGDIIERSEIKQRLKSIYNNLGCKKTAKATDLKSWFEIEEIQFRVNGRKFHGLKLVKKLI